MRRLSDLPITAVMQGASICILWSSRAVHATPYKDYNTGTLSRSAVQILHTTSEKAPKKHRKRGGKRWRGDFKIHPADSLSPRSNMSGNDELDGWVAQLMQCKPLGEPEVKKLCEKVNQIWHDQQEDDSELG